MVQPTADATFEPLSDHVGLAPGETWFGHPRQLARLFTTEMWERFGFYGLRALLTLYLAKHFLFSDQTTTGLYGGFTALVYLTPLIGGFIADRYLGSKKSVKFGAILMSLGYLTLCFGGPSATPYALIDGQRYPVQVQSHGGADAQYVIDGARRLAIRGQDDGSVTLTAPDGSVARTIPKGGFVSAGERSRFYTMLMLFGLAMITIGNGFFKPNISTIVGSLYAAGDRRRDAGFTLFYMGINLGSLFSQLLCPLLAVMIGWWAGFLLAAMVMIVFNVVFWTLFEQAGSSLTLFADRNTNLSIFGLFSMTAGQTQFFNPIAIVLLAPLFSLMWNALAKRGLEPSTPVKFGTALVGVGVGFLVLVYGTHFAGADFKVSVWWLALLYLIHSAAELCISPVGLSMITKLSLARIVGLMMGVWFLSISCAEYVGGIVAQVASVESVGGQVTNIEVSLHTYAHVFQTIGLSAAALGGVLLLLSPLIKRWMHAVR